MRKIRKGDNVVVIAGRDKGKRGTVLRVLDTGKVVVEGINRVKRHTRPNPIKGQTGGIVDKEMPIQASKVGEAVARGRPYRAPAPRRQRHRHPGRQQPRHGQS